jgi:hypothetical protein
MFAEMQKVILPVDIVRFSVYPLSHHPYSGGLWLGQPPWLFACDLRCRLSPALASIRIAFTVLVGRHREMVSGAWRAGDRQGAIDGG